MQKTNESGERFLDHTRRQAALRELEEQFNLRLTEEEVFRAVTLFFSLLAEGAFVNKEIVTQEVRRQLLLHTSAVQGAKKGSA